MTTKILYINESGQWSLIDVGNLSLSESQILGLVSDLSSKANDSAVIHNSGNETISGTKTFSSTISGSINGNSATVTTNANLSGDVTSSGNTTTLSNSGVTAGTYTNVTLDAKGRATSAQNCSQSTQTRTIQTVAASANGVQISSTRQSIVMYSVTITAVASLNSDQRGDIVLEICSINSSTANDWTTIGKVTNSVSMNLPALSVITTTSIEGFHISGFVPAGYYCRLRSISTTGSPTFSYISGQEVLL